MTPPSLEHSTQLSCPY